MYRTGDRIGSYVLQERIGRGAFGVVWLAEETTSLASHKVALKLPNEEVVNVEAIRQEARLWEQVKGHPNILPIIKADIVDDQIYIASEYAPDGSLSDWLRQHDGKAPSIDAAVEMVKGILAGLAHLHSRQVIHRDLKPENILLQGEIPRIADFGIARVLKDSQTSQSAGTPSYMAPEGFRGIRSEQTDIWAVGVIFYQLATGLLPFPQSDLMSLMNAIIYEPPQFYTQLIPLPLLHIVSRALEKDVAKRYRNAQEMREDLKKLRTGEWAEEFSRFDSEAAQLATLKVGSIDFLPAQNEAKAPETLPTERMQITAEAGQGTEVICRPAKETFSSPGKNRLLKWMGGALAAIVVIAGVAYTRIGFSEKPPGGQETANENGAANTARVSKTFSPEDYADIKAKWAEWALMLEDDDYEQIIRETTEELARRPNNSIAYRMRATAHYNLNDKESGRKDVREALRLTENPVIAEEYEARCYALMALNKSDEALQNCAKAIESDSDLSLAYNVRGTIYHQKQMYDLAIADYTEAINRIERATFLRNRAITYEKMGRKDLAIADEKRAENLDRYRKPNPEATPAGTKISDKPAPTKADKPQPAMQKPVSKPDPKPAPQKKPAPSKVRECALLGEC